MLPAAVPKSAGNRIAQIISPVQHITSISNVRGYNRHIRTQSGKHQKKETSKRIIKRNQKNTSKKQVQQ